jgi:type I restriction enzyme, R subunit
MIKVVKRRGEIFSHCESKLQAFLDFVLGQYVKQGVGELDQEKLASLLQLKYHTVDDALVQLGSAAAVRDAFVGFQQYLYSD